jgi:hypothetical protein
MYAIEHAYGAGINYRLYAKNLYFRMGHRPEQDAPRCWVKERRRAEKLKGARKEAI